MTQKEKKELLKLPVDKLVDLLTMRDHSLYDLETRLKLRDNRMKILLPEFKELKVKLDEALEQYRKQVYLNDELKSLLIRMKLYDVAETIRKKAR
jgi:hypothetical protein